MVTDLRAKYDSCNVCVKDVVDEVVGVGEDSVGDEVTGGGGGGVTGGGVGGGGGSVEDS